MYSYIYLGLKSSIMNRNIKDLFYDQQLKNTPGITGLYNLIVLIDNYVWHLDVDLTSPNIEDDIKGLAVR